MARHIGGADVVLTVFMEGTSNPMDSLTTQIALFSNLCKARALSADGDLPQDFSPGHYKVSFAGCGVTNGVRGTLFAEGLRDQCAVILNYVDAILERGMTVRLNFVGLSRGGIGGLYLAQELSVDAEHRLGRVVLNALLFDPVPGNLISLAKYVDWLGILNANIAMDVSRCPFFGRVVVLYPYEPLPAIAFHAPLIPTFPEKCEVEHEVILGCHQGALWFHPQPDTCLSFARIRDFLLDCGSELDVSQNIARRLNVPDETLADMLDREVRRVSPSTRSTHSRGDVSIVRHKSGVFLNRSHEDLLRRLGRKPPCENSSSSPMYMLDIEKHC